MGKGYKDLLAEANAAIETYSTEDALKLIDDEGIVFIDVRGALELEQEGKLPGAVHASRGMLEFLVDPDSPYHNQVFSSGKKFLLYCASGGRSALAAHRMQEMGISSVAHIAGGFAAWKKAGGPLEDTTAH